MDKRAVVVLTNGIVSASEPTASTLLRLKAAADVFKPGDLLVASTGYTVNKRPVLDQNGFPVSEAVVAARYLVNELSIPESQVIAESFSRDTIGNIYFTFLTVLLPMKTNAVCMVTSAFHVNRVKAITAWVQSVFELKDWQIEFVAAENPELDEETEKLIQEREYGSAENIKTLSTKITTPADFVRWLFAEHKAYAFNFDPQPVSNKIQRAY